MRVVDICERGREGLEFLSFLAGKVNNLGPTVSATQLWTKRRINHLPAGW